MITPLDVPPSLPQSNPSTSNVKQVLPLSKELDQTEHNDDGDTSQSHAPRNSRTRNGSAVVKGQHGDNPTWGSNFWVTLVDPQTQTSFFACPATGHVSWDPPVGNFVLPPSETGEWWELWDDSRGLPYYYQTKTGETVWERPEGFVIPLGIIQNTALGRRLSQTTRFSKYLDPGSDLNHPLKRSQSHTNDKDTPSLWESQLDRLASRQSSTPGSYSGDPRIQINRVGSGRPHSHGQQLTPIPGSDASVPSSPSQNPIPLPSNSTNDTHSSPTTEVNTKYIPHSNGSSDISDTISRVHAKSSRRPHRLQQQQSLNAVIERIASSNSDGGHSSQKSPTVTSRVSSLSDNRGPTVVIEPSTPTKGKNKLMRPSTPSRSVTPRSISAPTVGGKIISSPIPNHVATLEMSPVKDRANGRPIPVHSNLHHLRQRTPTAPSIISGQYPILPADLATDIQQFAESDFARQYFSTHRTGFIFKRKVPVAQMMTWQKALLTSPLLTLNRSLNKDAIRVFKVIQCLMGDRERERPNVRLQPDTHASMALANASTTSLSGTSLGMLEEERWLLGEGLVHGELRDEVYCQLMKQLTKNPNTESVFKGWQLLCVLLITFPPSKNFETYLSSFIQRHTSQQEGRVDIMAKYCLRRLVYISRKGPRGRPPSIAEIEAASDAAFHPSTFGESLDAIIRLQERKYPQQKVPIILPFLADGILALGGPRAEGIFRVPGDSDSVSELKLRIDKGYYTTDGVNDPHVLASLMKLWLRELCDPLVPEEMYNECITKSKDADACVQIIERLPTINRRVVLFVISFLQLFLEERIQSVTKMTPANLALVMAPNLLRCSSDSMSVVFTNAQYEQIFVYNLLLHLQCNEADADYIPVHGLAAINSVTPPRVSKSRSRRPQ